jgi:hypothetical protein
MKGRLFLFISFAPLVFSVLWIYYLIKKKGQEKNAVQTESLSDDWWVQDVYEKKNKWRIENEEYSEENPCLIEIIPDEKA